MPAEHPAHHRSKTLPRGFSPALIAPVEAFCLVFLFAIGLFLFQEGRSRVRLMEQGAVVRSELAEVEKAVRVRILRLGVPPNEELAFHEYSAEFPPGSPLRSGRDSLGSRLGLQPTAGGIRVPRSSWEKLRHVVDDEFWAPWVVPSRTPLGEAGSADR